MQIKRSVLRLSRCASTATAGLMFLFAATATVASAGGPFDGLEGLWGGNGTVTYSSGTKERLRCRVQYVLVPSSDSISQALRCASDSYNFQINALYVHQNGAITGVWDEKYLEISGTLTGTARAGLISGNLHGPGFLADYEVSTVGNSQTVRIAAEGQEIQEVAVEVRKAASQ